MAATGAWTPEPEVVDAAAGTVTATLESLSPSYIADSAVYWSGVVLGDRADPPVCATGSATAPPWVQDVSLPNSRTLPLPLCFSAWTDTTADLSIVNNRGYPQTIHFYGVDVDIDKSVLSKDTVSASISGTITSAIAKTQGDSQTLVLPPTGQATVRLRRPPTQPASTMVTISAEPSSIAGRHALFYSLISSAAKQVNLGSGVTLSDCALSVLKAPGSDSAFLDGVQGCGALIADPTGKSSLSKLLTKISRAQGVLDFFYKLQDLEADIVYPPQIGFTIPGTGLVNKNIKVGPYDLGAIAPGGHYTYALSATGGTAPYDLRLYTGASEAYAKPDWATLTSDGVLTLDPPSTSSATYIFYVYAFDATGQHSPFARDAIGWTLSAKLD